MQNQNMRTNTESKQRRGIVWTWILSLIFTCLLAAGCGASAATDSAYEGGMNYDQKAEAEYGYSEELQGNGALGDMALGSTVTNGSSSTSNGNLQAVSSRKLITTVNMETETEHYDDLMAWLSARIAEYGGYVEYSETSGNQSSRRYSTITLRIPAASLETFLTGLAEESNVTYQSRSVKDVTLDYVDVESHKAALLIEQERLMALLEKAESLEDLLTIESRLTDVRYELERYESQLRTYDNQIDYSTIHLTIREVKVLTAPEPESFWDRVTTGFQDNLEDVTDGFTEFAIGFLSSIPTLLVWAVIAIVVILVIRKIGKDRKNRIPYDNVYVGGTDSKENKKKSKKRWGRGAQRSPQEEPKAYAEGDSSLQQEKKDGE